MVSTGVIASPFGTGKFVIENNATGLNLIEGARAVITGGLSVRNNGTGVDLKFGTRATFDGVSIGSITCDATVLSRPPTVCP